MTRQDVGAQASCGMVPSAVVHKSTLSGVFTISAPTVTAAKRLVKLNRSLCAQRKVTHPFSIDPLPFQREFHSSNLSMLSLPRPRPCSRFRSRSPCPTRALIVSNFQWSGGSSTVFFVQCFHQFRECITAFTSFVPMSVLFTGRATFVDLDVSSTHVVLYPW